MIRPLSTRFEEFQALLESNGQVVRDEASLATKKAQIDEANLQVIERQAASRFRDLGIGFWTKFSREQEENKQWFLWVAFQIETLCAQNTYEDILAALGSLPRDLPETFDRILAQLVKRGTSNINIGVKIFKRLAAAKQPLEMEQLREAIAIEPSQPTFCTRRLMNDVREALLCCGSLIAIDEEYSTAHFAHHSVKQHLLSACNNRALDINHFDADSADAEFGRICVTYLNLEELNEQIIKQRPPKTEITEYAFQIMKHALPPDNLSSMLALKLLKKERKSKVAIKLPTDLLKRFSIEENQPGRLNLALLPYIDAYWLLHTRNITPGDGFIWLFWRDLVVSGNYNTDPHVTPIQRDKAGNFDLFSVTELDHMALLNWEAEKQIRRAAMTLSEIPNGEMVFQNTRWRSAVNYMISKRKVRLLRALVEWTLDPACDLQLSDDFRKVAGYTHLEIAVVVAYRGDAELFQMCNMPIVPGVGLSVLVDYGFLRKLKADIIYEKIPDPYEYLPPYYRKPKMWTPLAVACIFGYEDIARHLLDTCTREELLPFIDPDFHREIMERHPKLQRLLHDYNS
ncbi:MAG: hypothetical protein MMC33_006237 [Icmadophila ericetorum]|nr:hypothetical protein [Icmadophila ericetorum]